jgi:LacI family transcriptional regulator
MNIYDVSNKAGVSIATVSRVLNNNTRVSTHTREKVLKVIDECGYTPNTFARGLGLNTMNTIGIMCADSSDPFIAKAIYYLEQDLRKNNYDVLLCCTGYQLDHKKKYMNLLLSKRTDAIILVGSNFVEINPHENDYIKLAALKVPIMMLNASLKGNNIYSTLCDDHNGVYDATKALIDRGHKTIHYIYNSISFSGNRKLSGFLKATTSLYPQEESLKLHTHYIEGGIAETTHYLESLHNKGTTFDSIVASDDTLAIGALKYAYKHKIKVPENLSIIGYNNSLVSICTEPEITTIDNKLESLCTSCITTLMGVFKNQSVPIETIFPSVLIQRGTTNL